MTFQELTEYLYKMRAFGARLGLSRMWGLCEALGHPERRFPIVHVAGTNGKGSVCALTESALRAAGYRVGLYTSPHLVYLGERIQVDRIPISQKAMIALVELLKPVAEALAARDPESAPTFFEFMTAAAFMHFVREKVDVAIIETGLGGRYDSTNVVEHPVLTAITSIGLDHTEYLGDTLEKIAFEKGGIFKQGTPVVLGDISEPALGELQRLAKEKGAAGIYETRRHFGDDLEKWPHSALAGTYQRKNAATARLMLELLSLKFPKLNEGAIARGFQSVRWAGRWQPFALKDGRTLILDGSHNPEGARVLDEQLAALRKEGHEICAITGVCGALRAQAILPVLARYAREIHLIEVNQPRACSFAQMRAILKNCNYGGLSSESRLESLFPAPAVCCAGNLRDTVVVAGSLYLVGEVMARLDPVCWNAQGLGFQDLL